MLRLWRSRGGYREFLGLGRTWFRLVWWVECTWWILRAWKGEILITWFAREIIPHIQILDRRFQVIGIQYDYWEVLFDYIDQTSSFLWYALSRIPLSFRLAGNASTGPLEFLTPSHQIPRLLVIYTFPWVAGLNLLQVANRCPIFDFLNTMS